MISRNKAMILQAPCTLTALNSVIVHLPFPSTEKENKMVSVTPVSATQVQVMKVFYSPIPLWCNLLPCAIWLVWQHANALFFYQWTCPDPLFRRSHRAHTKNWSGTLLLKCTLCNGWFNTISMPTWYFCACNGLFRYWISDMRISVIYFISVGYSLSVHPILAQKFCFIQHGTVCRKLY